MLKIIISLLIIILLGGSPLTISNENLELIKTQSVSTISEEDYIAVCQVVSAEARGESYVGQMAVAEVIKNRSELWNMSLSDVINAKNQFAKPCYNISNETKNAVKDVLINGETVFEGDHPTHFHSGSNPYWVKNKTFVKEIGCHKFYK